MKLRWRPMQAPLPRIQVWGAQDGFVSYVISCDTGCRQGDPFYGTFALSAQMCGGLTDHLGRYDTLAAAQAAAEASRGK